MSNDIDTFVKKYGIFANVEGVVYIRYTTWTYGQRKMARLDVNEKSIVRVRVRDKRPLTGPLYHYERQRVLEVGVPLIPKHYQMDVGL